MQPFSLGKCLISCPLHSCVHSWKTGASWCTMRYLLCRKRSWESDRNFYSCGDNKTIPGRVQGGGGKAGA
jgi:hypothetical protein